jgi:death-on-curing protein
MVDAIHDMQISMHNGLPGTRDAGALESALSRPAHKWRYGKPDLADCAAAYGFGILKNHAYNDANKRTALVALATFLEDNGVSFIASEADAVLTMIAVAAGEMDEKGLAEWLRANTNKRARQKK